MSSRIPGGGSSSSSTTVEGTTTFTASANKELAQITVADDTTITVIWEFWAWRTDTGAQCHRRYEFMATATGGTASLVGSNTLLSQQNGFSPTSVSVGATGSLVKPTFRLDASGGDIQYEYTVVTKIN